MWSKPKVKFCGKVMFCSQDIQVFVFLAISWFTKSVTAWWVLVHETKSIFEYISFEPQLIKLLTWSDRYNKQGQ